MSHAAESCKLVVQLRHDGSVAELRGTRKTQRGRQYAQVAMFMAVSITELP